MHFTPHHLTNLMQDFVSDQPNMQGDGWLRNGAWRHILPALFCEPQLLSNRGFWKVAMAAVVGATRPQSESRQLA